MGFSVGKLAFTKKDNYTRCLNSAVYSLAMREHSRLELFNKLKVKVFSEGVNLDDLLDELSEKNYLNEERFAECFVRSRVNRGQGRLKITNELQRKGISQSLIQQSMTKNEIDWYEIAAVQIEKKYGTTQPEDYKEKTKRMRFLSSRGFDTYIIRDIVCG